MSRIKDLLFLGIVVFGGVVMGMILLPSPTPKLVGWPVDRGDSASIGRPGNPAEVVSRVDSAFERLWNDQGLEPSPRADDLAIMRRASLALSGSIPSLQEVRAFEARPEGRRVADWVEVLLADRRFADTFAERFARAFVGTEDGPFIIYRRRRFVSWLSDQFHENRPYDQIVRDLIAGDGLWTDQPATNFLTVAFDEEEKIPDADRLAARASRALLGVRIDCAQCHDHPFQPWTQADFQGLAAFFGQARSGFTGIHDDPKAEFRVIDTDPDHARTIAPRVPFLEDLLPEQGGRREQLAHWITDPGNPSLARATVNRVWAILFGRPLVDPVDDLDAAEERPEVLDLLADDFMTHGYDLKRLVRAIAATRVFAIDSASEHETGWRHESAWAVFPLVRLRPDQVATALLQAGSLETIDRQSPLIVRFVKLIREGEFIGRYGDAGEDEFDEGCSTIPQRLLMLNGDVVREATKPDLFTAPGRIARLAPTDRKAVEAAYLAVLTRRPTPEEATYFEAELTGLTGDERSERIADLYWTLLNSSEFSWNH